MFRSMCSVIPAGSCGVAKVVHATVSKEDAELDRLQGRLRGHAPVREGPLCMLYVKNELMMSDGPNEHRTNYDVVVKSFGDVLIAGLGLGMIVVPILKKPVVTSVTVIEKYKDVDDLVTPHVLKEAGSSADKLKVIVDDIYNWDPPKEAKYDVIYFDIWASQSTDDLAGITRLKRRFASRLKKGGYQAAWREKELRASRRREVREKPWF